MFSLSLGGRVVLSVLPVGEIQKNRPLGRRLGAARGIASLGDPPVVAKLLEHVAHTTRLARRVQVRVVFPRKIRALWEIGGGGRW